MLASITVIIVTYNSTPYIRTCLDALYERTDEAIEVVVYDNCSHDDTFGIIQSEYPQIKLLRGTENIGFAAANNKAFDFTQNDILVFLNPDTIVQPNWLPPLLEELGNESVGAATPQLLLLDTLDHINTCGNDIHLSGITYCASFGQPKLINTLPMPVSAISGAAFVIKKDVFKQVGKFAQSFFMYYEDTDLSLRLRLVGLSCVVVPESQIVHDYQPHFTPTKLFYLERNRLLSLLSLIPSTLLLIMLPSLLFMEFITWGYALQHGTAGIKSKLSAWKNVWQRRNWIWQRRGKYAHLQEQSEFFLEIFTPHLHVHYVAADQSLLMHIVEWGAWLTAIPTLAIARLFMREKE